MELPRPSEEVVREYSQRFEQGGYGVVERALTELFEKFPYNVRLEEVLVKVAALNNLYNTNIYAVYKVAQHICKLGIDPRLEQGSPDVVEEIAVVKVKGEKLRRNYSFATKYCGFHSPRKYPIYDGYVDEMLWTYKKRDGFANFQRKELWESYSRYVAVIEEFREYYGLGELELREIDRFLWLAGREKRQG